MSQSHCNSIHKHYPVPSLSKAGYFIDKSGYLGASPDGVVVDEAGHSIKLVEVKCPFSATSMVSLGVCRGRDIISLARIGVKYDDPGCNTTGD